MCSWKECDKSHGVWESFPPFVIAMKLQKRTVPHQPCKADCRKPTARLYSSELWCTWCCAHNRWTSGKQEIVLTDVLTHEDLILISVKPSHPCKSDTCLVSHNFTGKANFCWLQSDQLSLTWPSVCCILSPLWSFYIMPPKNALCKINTSKTVDPYLGGITLQPYFTPSIFMVKLVDTL